MIKISSVLLLIASVWARRTRIHQEDLVNERVPILISSKWFWDINSSGQAYLCRNHEFSERLEYESKTSKSRQTSRKHLKNGFDTTSQRRSELLKEYENAGKNYLEEQKKFSDEWAKTVNSQPQTEETSTTVVENNAPVSDTEERDTTESNKNNEQIDDGDEQDCHEKDTSDNNIPQDRNSAFPLPSPTIAATFLIFISSSALLFF